MFSKNEQAANREITSGPEDSDTHSLSAVDLSSLRTLVTFPTEYNIPINDPKLRNALYHASGGRCFYTGAKIAFEEMAIDHVIPRAKGGPDNVFNYVVTTRTTNSLKGDSIDHETIAGVLYMIRATFAPRAIRMLQQEDHKKVDSSSEMVSYERAYQSPITRIDVALAYRLFSQHELNLAEFPLGLFGQRLKFPQLNLTFAERFSMHDSETEFEVPRSLKIVGSNGYGLPNWRDIDVLISIAHLMQEKQLESEDLSRYQIAKLLGLEQSGNNYDRIKLALKRLAATQYSAENLRWEPSSKDLESVEFRLIEDLHPENYSFQLSELAKRNLGSLIPNDFDLYIQLVSPAAKRILRFLEQRFQLKSEWDFDLREFVYDKLGVSRGVSYSNNGKRLVAEGVAELTEKGFLYPLQRDEMFFKRPTGRSAVRFVKNS